MTLNRLLAGALERQGCRNAVTKASVCGGSRAGLSALSTQPQRQGKGRRLWGVWVRWTSAPSSGSPSELWLVPDCLQKLWPQGLSLSC